MSLCLIDAAAWHDDMYMGVIIETPGMGVEYCGYADLGAEMFRVEAEVFKRADGRFEQDGVHRPLMLPCERAEFERQGEGRQEILDRQQLGPLAIKPAACFMVLAAGTTAVSTGTGMRYLFGAIGAPQPYFPGIGCPAAQDRGDGVEMPGQQAGRIFGSKGRFVLFNDGGQFHD